MNLTPSIERRLGNRGAGSIEFTLFSLVGLGILLCGMDLVNYTRARMVLDRVSSSLASLVTGYKDLYAGDFPPLYQVSQQTAGSLDVTQGNGATIFTGITNSSGTPTVAWRQNTPTSNPAFASSLGVVGGAPTNLPDNYVVPAGSSVIAVEVFSSVHPWFFSLSPGTFGLMQNSGPSTLSSLTMFQPRSALLSQVSTGNRP